MANLNAAALRMEAIKEKLTLKKLANSLASRRTNYKKNGCKHYGIDLQTATDTAIRKAYKDYVQLICGIDLKTFEDVNWNLPKKQSHGGVTVKKGTPEYDEYNRRASRKSKMRIVLEITECINPECKTLEQFVEHYTDADTADTFLSDAYNAEHKGCYSTNAYQHIKDVM